MEKYKAAKLPDLQGECPLWRRQGGHCRLGVTCRFASSHTPLSEEEAAAAKESDDVVGKEESNTLIYDVRRQLYRKNYPCPRSERFVTRLEKELKAHSEHDAFNLLKKIQEDGHEDDVGALADAEARKVGGGQAGAAVRPSGRQHFLRCAT